MKYIIASDIHGSAYYCRRLLEAFDKEEGEKRLVLLGDTLYHGPRNNLPQEYAPKEVAAMLNARRNEIYAVRGNCDAEIDQMVLQFPITADYMLIDSGDIHMFVTHGHLFGEDHLPPICDGDYFMQGHTHVVKGEWKDLPAEGDAPAGKYFFANPGSISIPKDGNRGYYVLDGSSLKWKELI